VKLGPHRTRPHRLRFPIYLIIVEVSLALVSLKADTSGPSLINFNAENYHQVDNPWGGADSGTGDIKVISGAQLEVSDSGAIDRVNFSPSVAVGDLNGDGLPDLVIADTRGYFWFYPNNGTKTKAVFNTGEVIPLWFGSEDLQTGDLHQDMVPRIQLVDFNGDGLLDLVVGTFDGSLYMLPNTGSLTQPVFKQPKSLDDIRIPTRTGGMLWCNFLAPCLYNWSGRGLFDLIMGEGTYSANSIYLLRNQGTNIRPIFDEAHTLRIIPGMGREHLTPRVIDWNGDGKPDIICGERSGYIDLFLNNSADPDNPTFEPGTHIRVGNQDFFGDLTSVNIIDLNDNKLPNLVVSSTDGRLLYATNTGTAGHPAFALNPTPLQAENPCPKIYLPTDWRFDYPYGNSYELLVATSADVEKGFTPPPEHTGKFALRAYVMTPPNIWFKYRYFVDPTDESQYNEHAITYQSPVPIAAATRYDISFEVKSDGNIENTRMYFLGGQTTPDKVVPIFINRPFGTSGDWQKVTDTISWESQTEQEHATAGLKFSFRWNGSGSIYIDDVTVRKAE
jgi:hypothetical protein